MISVIPMLISAILPISFFIEYYNTGLVSRFPTAILRSALGVLSFLSFYTDLILDNVSTHTREIKRLNYHKLTSVLSKFDDN